MMDRPKSIFNILIGFFSLYFILTIFFLKPKNLHDIININKKNIIFVFIKRPGKPQSNGISPLFSQLQ